MQKVDVIDLDRRSLTKPQRGESTQTATITAHGQGGDSVRGGLCRYCGLRE